MTVSSDRHLARIHALRCVICFNAYGRDVPAQEAHHIESVRGEHSDWATVPLCLSCHKELHARRRRGFYVAHRLTDVKLLAWAIREMFA